MTRSRDGFGWGALCCSFLVGTAVSLALTAAAFVIVNDTPIPFVDRIKQVASPVSPDLLDGQLDPNRKLYAQDQGDQPPAASPGAVATVTADGRSQTALPEAEAGRLPPGEVAVDTTRYWVRVGPFSKSEDAESMRARVSFIGLDAKLSQRRAGGRVVFDVRVGPFDDTQQVEEVKQSLADNGIEGVVEQASE